MKLKGRISLPVLLIAGGLAMIVAVGVANALHPRPKGATPIRVALVPAFEPCTAPNTTHAPPLSFPSCTPPVQTSDYVTVGTPDADGGAANSVGSVRMDVQVGTPGPPEDSALNLKGDIRDVRCKVGATTTCGAANDAGGADYTGELEGTMTLRVTDHYNGPNKDQAATMMDLPQSFNLHCAGTPDPTIGSTCVYPVVFCSSCPPPKEGVRTVIEVSQVQIRDGGGDGSALTRNDNTLFMVQGVFIP